MMEVELNEGAFTGEQAYSYLDHLSKKVEAISCTKEGEHYSIQLHRGDRETIKVQIFMVEHFKETIEDTTSLGISKFTYRHEIHVNGKDIDGKKFHIKTRLYSDEGVYNCDMVRLKWE